MENQENQAGAGFTAPPVLSGNADLPKSGGRVTVKSETQAATKSAKKNVRDINVVALEKGWFDCMRIVAGDKFKVSEQEFSSRWMQKI